MRMDMDTEGKVKVADQFWHRDMELGAPVEIRGCELGTVPRQGDPSREVGRGYHGDWNYHCY
jgi:hypothetical protein